MHYLPEGNDMINLEKMVFSFSLKLPNCLASIVGAANSCLTLLIAGVITSVACLVLYRKRKVDTRLFGAALILLGSHFIIYNLVSIGVPVYSSYLYLTDFWMTVLPILGIAVLKMKPFNVNV